MIYFFHGENGAKNRARMRELLDVLKMKRQGAEVLRYEGMDITGALLDKLSSSIGLFDQKHITILDGACENTESLAAFLGALDRLSDSDNVFLVFERELAPPIVKKISTRAKKTFVGAPSENGATVKKKRPYGETLFALADAFGAKNRMALWSRFARAKFFDRKSAEEIHGVLFWQARAILSAGRSKDAKDAGLAPFVYSKSKRYAKNYSKGELVKLASSLAEIYHSARSGRADMDTALELFILNIKQ